MDDEKPSGQKPVENHPDSVLAAASAGMEDPSSVKKFEPVGPNYHKKKRKFHPFLIIIVILLIAVAGIYWFLLKPKPAKAPAASTASSSSATQSNQTQTEHYESQNFSLGFDYPKGWKVTDAEGSSQLLVVSPSTQLKNAGGQQVSGQIVVHIVPDPQNIKGLDDKNNSTAVLDSEKITYTKPSQTQRANTYLSFINYAGSKQKGIDSIFITGDNGYQKEQAIPKSDIAKGSPIIYVDFNECPKSGKCTTSGAPITINVAMWEDTAFSKPIKTLLESLSIQ
jgi:hypothetical protein